MRTELSRDIAKARMKQSFERIVKACEEKEYSMMNFNIWEWWSGVGLYGLIAANENLNLPEYDKFLAEWFDKNSGSKQTGSVNRVIPCCVPGYLYKKTGSEIYKNFCDEYADWCQNKALLTENGGFAHVWGPNAEGKEMGSPEYRHQIWADSVMMACVFMIRYGVDTNDDSLIKAALKQISIHIGALFDEESSLFYHAYDCLKEERLGCFWGRGNGWIAASLAIVFKYVSPDKYDLLPFKDVFVKFMKKAYESRAENGFLHTLINRKDSYTESTASMLFGYAAAVGYKLNLLDEEFYDWAVTIAEGLEFEENGAVKYASGGTNPEPSPEIYMNIPYMESAYSFGLVLMLLSELSKCC